MLKKSSRAERERQLYQKHIEETLIPSGKSLPFGQEIVKRLVTKEWETLEYALKR